MKIYNKKAFAFGAIAMVLGLLRILMSIWSSFDLESIIIILFLLFFAIGSICRSLSSKLSREDKLNELDERNQFVELKSKSKSFKVAKILFLSFGLVFIVIGKAYEQEVFIGIGVGLAVAYSILMLCEIFTYFYYEKHM